MSLATQRIKKKKKMEKWIDCPVQVRYFYGNQHGDEMSTSNFDTQKRPAATRVLVLLMVGGVIAGVLDILGGSVVV